MNGKLRPPRPKEGLVPDVNCLGCGQIIYLEENTYANFQGPITCSECKTQQEVIIAHGGLTGTNALPGTYDQIWDIIGWEVTPDILWDLAEAARDYKVQSYKSSLVMCGRCIQAALLERNVPDQGLEDMIDEAKDLGTITEELQQEAHAVKFFRNTGAHPKNPALRNVTPIQAMMGIEVTKEFSKHLYPQLPPASPPGTGSSG